MHEPAPISGVGGVSEVTHPRRVLGLFDTTSVVIGAIIGVGIFFTPSSVARTTDSTGLALLAWGIGGLIALCGALTFAELGSRQSGVGAQYQIIRETYGPLAAFVFVFCNSTASVGGAIGIMALICARYIAEAVGWRIATDVDEAWISVMAAALIGGLAAANVLGVKWGAGIQNFTVLAKVFTLLAIVAIAIFARPDHAPAAPDQPTSRQLSPLFAVMAALVPVLFSYGGWQQALWVSGEVKNPRRNLPAAIIIGVLIVVIVYMLANWAYLHLLGVDRVAASKTLASDAVRQGAPALGSRIVAAAVGLSAFGVLNVQFLTSPRLIYAMACEGQFLRACATSSPRFGTPAVSILLMATVALVLLLVAGSNGLDRLTTGTVFVDGVFFVMTGAAVFIYRRRQKDSDAFRMPGYPFVPAIFVIGELGVVIGAYLDRSVRSAAIIGAIWIAAGALLYFWRFRKQPSQVRANDGA